MNRYYSGDSGGAIESKWYGDGASDVSAKGQASSCEELLAQGA